MIGIKKKNKAQSIIEFVLLFGAVISAVVIMYNYFQYSLNANLKRTAEGVTYTLKNVDRY